MNRLIRWTLASLALALSSYPAQALTLSSSITQARVLSRDASSSARQRFTDAQITALLNEGQSQAIARTWCAQSSTTIQLVVGTTYYAVPSNFLAVRRVTRDNLQIQEITPAALDSRSRGWETVTGVPLYYFINFSTRGMIGFSPFPTVATDTATIKMDYFIKVNDLSSSSDQPFNGIQEFTDFHYGLPLFAAYRMTLIMGDSTLAGAYLQGYESMVQNLAQRCTDRPNYLPGAIAKP